MEINRLKIVLIEQKRTGKWLAEKLGKRNETVSRWCNNKLQPSVETLYEIAGILNCGYKRFIKLNLIQWTL